MLSFPFYRWEKNRRINHTCWPTLSALSAVSTISPKLPSVKDRLTKHVPAIFGCFPPVQLSTHFYAYIFFLPNLYLTYISHFVLVKLGSGRCFPRNMCPECAWKFSNAPHLRNLHSLCRKISSHPTCSLYNSGWHYPFSNKFTKKVEKSDKFKVVWVKGTAQGWVKS